MQGLLGLVRPRDGIHTLDDSTFLGNIGRARRRRKDRGKRKPQMESKRKAMRRDNEITEPS